MCRCSFEVLGIARTTNAGTIKAAFKKLAKEWHPDLHPAGPKRVAAEERFKLIKQAYERALVGDSGPGRPGGMRGDPRGRQAGPGGRKAGPGGYESWGGTERYGAAGKSGYNPYQGYMNFDKGTAAGEARERSEAARMRSMLTCLGVFVVGLSACMFTGYRDNRKRESGELVDAYFNQVTRRWERATPMMMKDPLLSTMVHLKPPEKVHKGANNKVYGTQGSMRQTAKAKDGTPIDVAYRQRQTGSR